MLRYKRLCHFQSFALVLFDSILTFHGLSSRLSIRHPEHIISLDSPVHSTITWNRFSQFRSLIFVFLYPIKDIDSLISVLLRLLLRVSISSHSKECRGVLIKKLLLHNFVSFCSLYTIEFVESLRWNRLLKLNQNKLPLSKSLPLSVLPQSMQQCHE